MGEVDLDKVLNSCVELFSQTEKRQRWPETDILFSVILHLNHLECLIHSGTFNLHHFVTFCPKDSSYH